MLAIRGDAHDRLRRLFEGFEQLYSELFSPADRASGIFSYLDTAGRTKEVPLTTVRAIYLPGVLQRVRELREVYDLATQLRMRRVEQPARTGGVIVTDRRAEEAARRASA